MLVACTVTSNVELERKTYIYRSLLVVANSSKLELELEVK